MKHALIFGASSIAGLQLAKQMLLDGNWKVSGVEKTPKEYSKNIPGYNIIYCDLKDPKQVQEKLIPVYRDVTHLIWMTWIGANTEEEQVKVNLGMLKQVVDTAIERAPLLQHIYLQTGTKYYNMHLGPQKGMITPSREDHPRIGPNFYYAQEDYIAEAAKRKEGLKWSVARPPCIIGFTTNTAMNVGVSMAVYAAVMKELGQPLIFPYGREAYHCLREFADNRLLTKFILWMMRDEHGQCNKQAFNIANGDYYRMEHLWPKLAAYFGMEAVVKEQPNFNMAEFMRDKKEVWNNVVKKHNLKKYDLNSLGTWDFFGQMLQRPWDELTLVNKAYTYGWNDRIDTYDCFTEFFDQLQHTNVIPPQQAATGGRPVNV